MGLPGQPSNQYLFIQSKDQVPEPYATMFRQIERWAQGVAPLNFGVGTPLVGTNPPAIPSSAYLTQSDYIASLSITGGAATITFPQPFPNGVMVILPSNPANRTDALSYDTITLTGFDIHFSLGGTGTVSLAYYALGW